MPSPFPHPPWTSPTSPCRPSPSPSPRHPPSPGPRRTPCQDPSPPVPLPPMAAAPLPPLSVPLPCPTPAHREESLPASPPREVPPIGGAPVSPGGHDSDDDEPPVLHPPAPEPRPTHHQPHHHIALASCGLHPAHDTSIHAGRDLTPSMYYSRSPARPYHHSPHTLERPPHAGLFPASRPGQMATQCVAASGRGSCHTPEGSSPPDHCHGPHTPERPPHAGGFPASPPGQMATQGVAAATPPRAPRPQTTASTTAPWCSTTAASVLPSPAAPRGARGAAHHPQTAVPPRSGAAHPPAAPHATPRAIPIPGGLRSPCRSPSPLGEVYPYERRGWVCAAREWEALTTTITAPRQSREIGRARAMGTLPLRQYLMTSTGFHKGGEEQRVSPPQPAPPPPTPSMPSLWIPDCWM
ncbi:uncharacterized protein LOC135099529 isoform X2 [Scylla paramamosain]|uniref:uncharacterized protein LOC135099529 isoform X2 n=1 Tax=Scylla paramamosain TaxID=85552 RepID=UPI003082F135